MTEEKQLQDDIKERTVELRKFLHAKAFKSGIVEFADVRFLANGEVDSVVYKFKNNPTTMKVS